MPKKLTPIERLMAAADEYSIVRAEANWTNGYRAMYEVHPHHKEEADHLHAKEMTQWKAADRAHHKMKRTFQRVLRELRDGGADE